jgi:hypothetical protein
MTISIWNEEFPGLHIWPPGGPILELVNFESSFRLLLLECAFLYSHLKVWFRKYFSEVIGDALTACSYLHNGRNFE